MTKKAEQLPIEFCWGTFCKSVLERGSERTIYSVISSLRIDVAISDVDASQAPADKIQFPMQELALYALFKRKPSAKGQISVPLTLEIEDRQTNLKDVIVTLPEKTTHSQQVINFQGATIEIPNSPGEHKAVFRALFKNGNNIVGTAEFLMNVTVSHEPEKDKR